MDPPSHPMSVASRLTERLVAAWRYDAGGIGPPADRAKRRHVLELFRARGHKVFVEAGTYLGGTVAFMVPHAERIISVEIEPRLYEAARERFARVANVELHLGDAAELIPKLVADLREAPLVWLDGHFTGGVNTDQPEEVEPSPRTLAALGALNLPRGITIVVDDLRLFGRGDGFPSLDALVLGARRAFPDADLSVGLDSLAILA